MTTMSSDAPDPDHYADVLRQCACFNLRKASRAVTQLYDEALAPLELRVTQLSILVSLAANREMTLSAFARFLVMSPSTLARNLAPLERRGYVARREKNSRKLIHLTPEGEALILQAFPLWQTVQARISGRVDPHALDDLITRLNSITDAALPIAA